MSVCLAADRVISGEGFNPELDYRAGAYAEGRFPAALFAYESGALFGSLDMGSLGS